MDELQGDIGRLHSEARAGKTLQNFEIGEHRYSTRTSESFEALARDTGESALIWFLRHPLSPASDAAKRFAARLDAIRVLDLPIPKFKLCGVDAAGSAYLVMEPVSGRAIVEPQLATHQQQRLFVEAVRTVAALHDAGITLGDIGEQSFIANDDSQFFLVGVLGTFEGEARQTAMLPPPQTLHYLSPEQRSGAGSEPGSDVYALGVLGYRLFTGKYLTPDGQPQTSEDPVASAAPPSVVRPDAPVWVDDILGKCLEVDGRDRYPTAGRLLDALEEAIRTNVAPGGSSRWSHRTMIFHAPAVRTAKAGPGPEPRRAPDQIETEPERRRRSRSEDQPRSRVAGKRLLVLGAVAAVGIVITGSAFMFSSGPSSPPKPRELGDRPPANFDEEISFHEKYAPAELKPALRDMVAPGTTTEKRQEALERLAKSDDPIAYTVLISTVKAAPGGELKRSAQQLIIERIRRQGLASAAGVLEKWLLSLEQARREPTKSPIYAELLAACDSTLPIEARRFKLHKAYAQEPLIALQLTAGLSIDDPDPDHFVPVLRQLLSAQLGRSDLNDKGAGALLLAHKALSLMFDDQLKKMLSTFTAGDLAWSLLQLADNENTFLYDAVQETLNRKIVPPFQEVFLRTLFEADRFSTPSSVKRALVKFARGEFSELDITAIGRWQSMQTEPVLLGVCAVAADQDIALVAFDTLAARSLVTEPARSLTDWVKTRYWEHRSEMVKAVGILGHGPIASQEQIDYAFTRLMPFAKSLLKVLVNAGDPTLIRTALDRMGELAGADELLPLLNHDDKRVRIAAIQGLKGKNELTVLQAIVRAHSKEKDPEVREYYCQAGHWVACER